MRAYCLLKSTHFYPDNNTMKNYFFPFLLLFVVFSACQKKEPLQDPPTAPKWTSPLAGLPDEGRIRWDNLKVGQRSRYLYFEANGNSLTTNITPAYNQDTLVLAITGQDAQGFILKEFVIPDSVGTFMSDTIYVYANHLKQEQDSLKFIPEKPYNSLIFNSTTHALSLSAFAAPVTEYPEACPYLGYRSDKWEGFTNQHTHLGHTYSPLNLVYDYIDMPADGWGYMYAYDVPNGLVRMTWVSFWTTDLAKGWDLLDE